MNNIFNLTKILIKSGLNIKLSSKNGKNRKVLMGLVLLLAFAPLISMIIVFAAKAYEALKTIEQEALLLALVISISAIVIFVFGIIYIISVFYHSKDIERLLPLPVKPYEIVAAKFATVVFYEYITEMFIMLPIFITYGVVSSAGFMYAIYGAIIFLLFPIIPLAITGVIVMVIMRFTGFAKNKDRFAMYSGILALVVAIGSNLFIQRYFSDSMEDSQEILALFAKGDNSFVSVFTRSVPGAKFAVDSLINSSQFEGILSILLFILTCGVILTLFLLVSGKLYFEGVIGISESTAKRKKISNEDLEKSIKSSSQIRAYTIKELKLLFRTPIYFMNCVLMNFIWPLMLVFMFIAGNEGISELTGLMEKVDVYRDGGLIIAIATGLLFFMAGTSSSASSSISREGSLVYISRFIPMSFKDQIIARVLSSIILSFFGVISLIIVGAILLPLPWEIYAVIFFAGINTIVLMSLTGIMIDTARPKLVWSSEQEAVKQNLNVLFNMIIGVVLAAIIIVIGIVGKLNTVNMGIVCIIGLGILNFLAYRIITTKTAYAYGEIEG